MKEKMITKSIISNKLSYKILDIKDDGTIGSEDRETIIYGDPTKINFTKVIRTMHPDETVLTGSIVTTKDKYQLSISKFVEIADIIEETDPYYDEDEETE